MAIFKRRKPRDFLKKVCEAVWPSQGWPRTVSYYRHRLFRDGDSVYRITAGLAIGASISFVPLIGTHLLQAAFLGFIMRASFVAAFIGTALGNPLTFPFLFTLAYKVGALLFALFGGTDILALPDFMNQDYFAERPLDFMLYLIAHPLQLFVPMLIGGYICAILCWPVAYGVLYYPVKMVHKAYHSERLQRLLHRKRKAGKK